MVACIAKLDVNAFDEPFVAWSQSWDACSEETEEDFPGAPVPVWNHVPSRIIWYVLVIEHCTHYTERSRDYTKAHKRAKARFAAKADLHLSQNKDRKC